MLLLYRIVALIFIGYGTYLVLGDLPPYDNTMFGGLEFTFGLYFLAFPGALNLINSFLGIRFAFVRWVLFPINIVLLVIHIAVLLDIDSDHLLFLSLVVGALLLLVLSFLLARNWGKAEGEAEEGV